jgi:hypothetical protein
MGRQGEGTARAVGSPGYNFSHKLKKDVLIQFIMVDFGGVKAQEI